jgi:hypothetical protein
MRKKIYAALRVGLAVLPLWFLTDCPHTGLLCVKATESSAAGLTIAVGEGADCSGAVKLTSIEVYKSSDYESRWAVTAREPTSVARVTYAVVPPGFEQSLPPTPLAPGNRVTIGVKGPGVTGGFELTLK